MYNYGNSYLYNLANAYVPSGNQPSGKKTLNPNFINEKTEAQRAQIMCPRSVCGRQGWEPKVHLSECARLLPQVQACVPPVCAGFSSFELLPVHC